jgi:hypothetical protein
MPHHLAPRLGSVCPHSGIAPWARREGPSMAQRGYPGIHAGMPTAQCLRSASVVNGAPRSTSTARRPNSRPDSPGRTPVRSVGAKLAREGAGRPNIHVTELSPSRASSLPQEARGLIKNQVGSKAASRWTLISGAPLTTLAERRCCGVGNPAWMPG